MKKQLTIRTMRETGFKKSEGHQTELYNEQDIERLNLLAESERKVKELRSNLKKRQLPSMVVRLYILTGCYCFFSSLVCLMLVFLQSHRNSNITGGLDSIFRFNDRQSSIPRHAVNTKKAKLAVEGLVANKKKDFAAIVDRVDCTDAVHRPQR